MAGVRKSFGATNALKNVSFQVEPAEVHALIGENGAGKSTLGKILAGIYCAEEGEIHLEGKRIHPAHPLAARQLGIAMVHQELAFCPRNRRQWVGMHVVGPMIDYAANRE